MHPAPEREPHHHYEHGADNERQYVLEVVRHGASPLSRYWQTSHRPPACLLDFRPIPGDSNLFGRKAGRPARTATPPHGAWALGP